MIGGSTSPLLKAWSREEDAVLLRHALQCGTKQWGELERGGQLNRSNKSCCNRYIFLRRERAAGTRAGSLAVRASAAGVASGARQDRGGRRSTAERFLCAAECSSQPAACAGSPSLVAPAHITATAGESPAAFTPRPCPASCCKADSSESKRTGFALATPLASCPTTLTARHYGAACTWMSLKPQAVETMLHSSEAIGGSASPSLNAWSREEDAVLLRHALQCGTKQWGELERSGQLKRSNKSCCNRYIFLRRKFLHRFQHQFWSECFPRGAAPPSHISVRSLALQQQQQQGGVGSHRFAAVSDATAAFCKLMRETSLCTNPAEVVREEPLCTDPAEVVREEPLCTDPAEVVREETLCTLCTNPAEVVRGARCRGRANVMRGVLCCSDPAAPSLPNKRPRDGFTGPVAAPPVPGSTIQRPQSLESGCARQGKRSRVHPALWPRVGSESALPDDVLLGVSTGEAGYSTPCATCPVPLTSQVAVLTGTRAGSLPVRASAAGVVSKFEPPGLSLAACPTKRTAALYGRSMAAWRSGGSHTAQLQRVLGRVSGSRPGEKRKEKGEMRGLGEGAAGASREAESSRGWEHSVIERGEVGNGE
ncbi:unnamed protein product [Closterium sp. NIES-64]|nr:unnamed protein product [Closterium sp. NIES-64]